MVNKYQKENLQIIEKVVWFCGEKKTNYNTDHSFIGAYGWVSEAPLYYFFLAKPTTGIKSHKIM